MEDNKRNIDSIPSKKENRIFDEKQSGVKKLIQNIGMDKLLILALCGILLIIISIPAGEKKKTTKKTSESAKEEVVTISYDDYCTRLENRVENLLTKMEGVSNVKVMITLKASKEEIVLTEASYEQNDRKENRDGAVVSEENTYKNQSVVVYEKDAKGNTIPYVVKENMPQIEGIAVVAKGGDNPENILKITDALLALFNVDAHKISVIGMR